MSLDLSALLQLPQGPACVAVACSGGRDSVALLHAVARAARDVPSLKVMALHVHHGLSLQADAWAAHVQALCAEWAGQGWPVGAVVRRVHCELDGRSVEAVAREARYAALAEMAREEGAACLLLAHHRRDQAETLLLQALRGASVAGLAAMPAEVQRLGVRWLRPWLASPREAIEAYVAAHGLAFVDDDSNADPRFARNRLRHAVWPALSAAFPQAEQALADATRRLGDAQAVLDAALAAQVRSLCQGGVADHAEPPETASLDAMAWAELDAPHRRQTLMHWYKQVAGQALPASWVERLADEVPAVLLRDGLAVWPPVGLGLYRQRLCWTMGMAHRAASAHAVEDGGEALIWGAGDACVLPAWRGVLHAVPVSQQGVPRTLLDGLSVRARTGGELFQLGPNRPARLLRKQFQQMGVPAWCRDGPLVWSGAQLVFVPGLGMDARVWASEGEPQWALVWQPGW